MNIQSLFDVLEAATGLFIPIWAWLWRDYGNHRRITNKTLSEHHDKILILQTQAEMKYKDLESLQREQGAHGVRLAATEAAISAIQLAQRKADERMSEISGKLDKLEILPELKAAIVALTDHARVSVPRREFDLVREATENRLENIETKLNR